MSAPTTVPAVRAAAGTQRADSARVCWLAGLYYLVAAIIVTMWLWRDPASRVVAANPYDSDQFAWFFRYDASAVAHLRLPALTTAAMNAPGGINLMWNTPMLLPGVLLAPVTLLAGPQVSLTVLMTAGFAGSALAMFAVLRRWDLSLLAAAAGGLVYGFSPALIQSAQGHYDLQFAVLPPLIADAIVALATGRSGPGRRVAVRRGAWLGLLMAAQVFISEELLFGSVVAALILLVTLAAGSPRAVAGRVRDTLVGVSAAVAVLGAITGYALWEQFFGPVRQHGSPFTPDHYKNDLAGFVRPPSSMLLHTHGSAAFAAAFQGQLPEYLAYLGWPMLIALAAATVLFWPLPAIRAMAVAFAALEVFSLGGTLLAAGHEYSWIKLPWYWVQTLPVTGAAIPDRFSILADGAAAALFAFALDAARARWPAAAQQPARLPAPRQLAPRQPAVRWPAVRWPAVRWPAVRWPAPRQPVARWAVARWAVAGTALIAIAAIVPRPLPPGSGPGVPAGWTATFAALRLPAGAHVLVLPVPASTFTEPLRWQADTGVPASMFGGYFMGPGLDGRAATDGAGTPPGARYLDQLWEQSSGTGVPAAVARKDALPPRASAQMRAQVMAWHPAAVVAVAAEDSALGRFLTGLLGPPTISSGAVLAWRR